MRSLAQLHEEFPAATVRGEDVHIIGNYKESEKIRSVLGASVEGATVLVAYPDGEQGYVKESDLRNG